jgi:hypothetical protein
MFLKAKLSCFIWGYPIRLEKNIFFSILGTVLGHILTRPWTRDFLGLKPGKSTSVLKKIYYVRKTLHLDIY